MRVNVAMVIKQSLRDSHKQAGHQKLHAHTHKHTQSCSSPQPRLWPSVTLSPYERQIVWAISGGPERLLLWSDGGSGCPQAGAAGSVTHTPLSSPSPLASSHLQYEMFLFAPEPYEASRKSVLAFAHSVLNAPVSTTELQLRYSNHSNWQGHKICSYQMMPAHTCSYISTRTWVQKLCVLIWLL